MLIARLAWRNLWRNKRRTIITLVSIGFGLTLAILSIGMGDYFYAQLIDTGARLGDGHVTVEHPDYRAEPTLDHHIVGASAILKKALAIEGVNHAAPLIQAQAILSTAYGSASASYQAIDMINNQPINFIPDKMVQGTYLEKDDTYAIVIGQRMAKKLKVKVGSKVVLTTTDASGDIISTLLRVKGIFRTGSTGLDGTLCHLSIHSMRTLLGLSPDGATQIALMLTDQRQSGAVAHDLNRLLKTRQPPAVALTWRTIQPDLASYVDLDGASNYIMQVILFMLIAAGILNTLLMSVLERQREFGIMLSLGMSTLRLAGMILFEALFIGLIGVAAGTAAGLTVNRLVYQYGIDLSSIWSEGTDIAGIVFEPVLRARIYTDHLLALDGLVLGLILFISLYPTWKAVRVQPVEVLQSN